MSAEETKQESTTAPAETPAPAEKATETPTETPTVAAAAVAPEAVAAAPAAPEAAAAAPAEPAAPKETPLTKLTARLPDILKNADHTEMWGVELAGEENLAAAPAQVVLQKFLRANDDDVAAAEKQLSSALEWRKKMQPLKLINETFDKKKFGDLGYVTTHKNEKGEETVITWNVYGAVKDNKATFGDVTEFIKWRAALMELGVQKLHLNDIEEVIPDKAEDKHKMIQVHDYLSVSFFRMDPSVKAASKETIQTFSMAYPELLSHKYFVNVPAIMGWMYAAMKLFLAPATLRKFHPMSSGTTLATELKDIAPTLPKEYGGKAGSVQEEGETVKLEEKAEPEPKAAATEESKKDAAETEAAPAVAEDKKEAAEDKPAETTAAEAPAAESSAPAAAATEEAKPAEAEAEAEKKEAA